MPGTVRKLLLVAAVALVAIPPAHAATAAAGPRSAAAGPQSADAALVQLSRNAAGNIDGHLAPETGVYDFVRATGKATLARDNVKASPKDRSLAFLRTYGAVAGLDANERVSLGSDASVLRYERTTRDLAGKLHARFAQRYRTLGVFGAELIVHMDGRGITAVSGQFVPGVHTGTTPKVSRAEAGDTALAIVGKTTSKTTGKTTSKTTAAATVEKTTLSVYRVGLVEGVRGRNALAWSVQVSYGPGEREQVWIDAINGGVLTRLPLVADARDRRVYSPEYHRGDPDMFMWRKEGDPDTNVRPWDNLYRFTGQVYDFFSTSFARDSFDAKGATMRTVYLINDHCPNAYWNGSSTNYCPAFDADDVVAHEWGHAYTEYTQGLIYFCQPGALNESYSDIWGETIDLLNGEDAIGGSTNDKPYPHGQRWLVGEDLGQQAQELLLRDMWDPQRLASPGKVSDPEYVCDTGDGGGVHTNSGVPNHAYAMLVDGKTYNGVTINGIGLTKAAHIYFQSMTHYQTPTTKFAVHEQGLKASCEDLLGMNLRELFTGAASGKRITAADCASVANVAKAVEMSNNGKQCNFQPMFLKASELCPGATVHFNERFEDGLAGWTLASEGVNPEWPDLNWKAVSNAPKGHPGKAAYAVNINDGSCESGDDVSGTYRMDSPSIAIPASAGNLKLRFDHYVAAEYGYDGGNLAVSVNGGDFALVPQSAYLVNGPNAALFDALPGPVGSGNMNPKAEEMAWTGANGGDVIGSWGTTVADLSGIAKGGDTIVLRFEFGNDCSGGWFGWYVDDVQLYTCPVLPAPDLTIAGGSVEQATKSYVVKWTRPSDAVGPDTVQESQTCLPLITDDAESGLGKWDLATTGDGAPEWTTANDKPNHDSNAFKVRGDPAVTGTTSTMTWKEPIAIGAGATTLTFSTWHANEGDDQMRVEVSTNGGKTWAPVFNESRSDYAPLALVAFEQESMMPESVDLSKFAGSTVRLRFNYVLGAEDRPASTPLGWYVDDVQIKTESWKTIATVAGTSLSIPGKARGGVYCYRVATSYRINGKLVRGDFSKPASVRVTASSLGTTQVKGARKTLPSTGAGDGVLPAVALFALATLVRRTLRRKPARA
jgi:Zn-dependent metalloprotease